MTLDLSLGSILPLAPKFIGDFVDVWVGNLDRSIALNPINNYEPCAQSKLVVGMQDWMT